MSNVTEFEYPARRARGARLVIAWLLAGTFVVTFAAQTLAGQVCKPVLRVTGAQLSAMKPPTLERRWTAQVLADASRCASTAGYFDLGMSRMKEYGPEIEFREQFIWSTPHVEISVDFSADEAVESYWIDRVQACPCAK
jgi:hypothetical protein